MLVTMTSLPHGRGITYIWAVCAGCAATKVCAKMPDDRTVCDSCLALPTTTTQGETQGAQKS